jgi:hypothetical protein
MVEGTQHKRTPTAPNLSRATRSTMPDLNITDDKNKENVNENNANYKTTSHWKTNYGSVNHEVETSDKNRSERPLWSFPRQAYVSNRCYFKTEYMNKLGTYGDNPRKKLNHESDKIEIDDDELT